MLKTYYRNRFRIRNLDTNKIEKLNSSVDKNGNDIWVEGFDTYKEALREMARLLIFKPHYRLRIESYSTNVSIQKSITDHRVNKQVERLRLFSGKGLKENVSIAKKDETKYQPDKYYDQATWFAQSAERNKGLTLLPKFKDKSGFSDPVTASKIAKLRDHTSFDLSYCVVDSIRKQLHKFTNRKDIKDWLAARGYSAKAQRRIVEQVYSK